jgi:hypothetical protein
LQSLTNNAKGIEKEGREEGSRMFPFLFFSFLTSNNFSCSLLDSYLKKKMKNKKAARFYRSIVALPMETGRVSFVAPHHTVTLSHSTNVGS